MPSGQVTIWIILSIVFFSAIGFLYHQGVIDLQRSGEFAKVSQQWDVSSVQGLVQSCLNKVATQAVFYFGMVGGDIGGPFDFLGDGFFAYDQKFMIPYFYVNGESRIPTYAQAAGVIGGYIDWNLPKCTGGFKEIRGFQIFEEEPETMVLINEKSIDFNTRYLIKLRRGSKESVLEKFSFSLPSRLYEILRIADIIVSREVQDDRFVHWDFLVDVTRKGYNITAHAERDNTIIYRIVDPLSPLFFEPFVFQFANKVNLQ